MKYFDEKTRKALSLLPNNMKPKLPVASIGAITYCKNLVDVRSIVYKKSSYRFVWCSRCF
ncbi:hypothetical protein BDF21DRAFT_418802 [Thamnidium elegans]|nr:hypothetical protein BDF21DRAFT_418802 [Thamnidium elegans]